MKHDDWAGAANSDKERSVVGVLGIAYVLLAVLVSVAVSLAVSATGSVVSGGWLAWAAFLVVYCAIIGTTIRKVAREERDDG